MSALRNITPYITEKPIAASHIIHQVGNTPLLSFKRVTAHLPNNVQVFAKAEWYNPGGSVKDRPAYNIVKTALNDGRLSKDKILTDSTSGNTGIAYAMLGAALDFGVKLFLPESASSERIAILRAYGVDIEFTDAGEGSDGAIRAVRELVKNEPERYFYADQYNNPANWQAHYLTTGPEIWEQTQGKVTHWVAGLGTSGTLMGTGRRLKEYNPNIRIISSQPDSPFHGLEGWKHMETAIKPGIYDDNFAERDVPITTEDGYEMTRRLAREEGYLVGLSSGASMVAALHVAEGLAERGESGVVVTLFPDNAYKYLSSPMWQEA